jgi:hypothetical protein
MANRHKQPTKSSIHSRIGFSFVCDLLVRDAEPMRGRNNPQEEKTTPYENNLA